MPIPTEDVELILNRIIFSNLFLMNKNGFILILITDVK